MIGKGVIGLDDPTTKYLPDFKPKLRDGSTPTMTVRQLLTHTSGLGYGEAKPDDPYRAARISGGGDQPGLTMEENFARLMTVPLFFAPGTAWKYGMSIDVLGGVMGKAHGGTPGDAVKAHLTGPLGMKDTGFSVSDPARLGAVYADDVNGPVRMNEPTHELAAGVGKGMRFSPSRIFNPASYHSGGSGMVSSGPDFMKMLNALLAGDILSAKYKDMARTNQIGDMREKEFPGTGFGFLASVITDPAKAKVPYSVGTFRWGGVYGHSWFVDPKMKMSAVLMTNTAVEGCNGTYPAEIRDAIYGRSLPA
jgi:CubicO group peptidase (beta-lactamase class C family)